MAKKVLHTRKKYRRRRRPVIILTSIVLVAAFLIVLGISLLLRQFWPSGEAAGGGSENSQTVSEISSSTPSSKTEDSAVNSSEAVSSEEGSVPPVSSAAPSSEEPSTPASSSPEGGSNNAVNEYFSNACFIGDSRTEGLRLYGSAPTATFYSAEGLAVNTVFTQPVVTVDGKKISVVEAQQKNSFDRIYIMFGINELGWPVDSFVRSYGNFVQKVKELQPNAKIYVENIFPVTANKSNQSDIYNNTNIRTFNEKIKAMAQEKGAIYVDLYSMLSDENGNLPKEYSPDGVHLEREYCDKWVRSLMENGD